MQRLLQCLTYAAAIALQLPATAADSASAPTNHAVMQSFVHLLYEDGKVREAYERYAAPDLVQHNPNIADGREAAILELEGLLQKSGARFEVQRMIVEGDHAVLHFRGKLGPQGPGAAVIEIFRLSAGKIVEHWDVFQIMGGPAQNPHPYF